MSFDTMDSLFRLRYSFIANIAWWMILLTTFGVGTTFGLAADAQHHHHHEERAVLPDPFIVILGIAQDGGYPQIGCSEPLCEHARVQTSAARMVASLALVDPREQRRWLVDATPDLPKQVDMLTPIVAVRPIPKQGRPALFDGIFLTHAHIGHYSGLMYFGREVYNHPRIPVYMSHRMAGFLSNNGPWSLLFDNQNLSPRHLLPRERVFLSDQLTVEAIAVPHRDEFSDTFAFYIRGPNRAILYVPDIDKWHHWPDIESWIAKVDLALLDGTFFADGEIPGRSMADIPHPFIEESLARFGKLPENERRKIQFIHLNHTNPALDPKSAATDKIKSLGMAVARQGAVLGL